MMMLDSVSSVSPLDNNDQQFIHSAGQSPFGRPQAGQLRRRARGHGRSGSTPIGIGDRGCREGGRCGAEGLRAGTRGTCGERRQWGSLFSSRCGRVLQG